MKEYKRFTERRNGDNAIPLRNSVCGVDLPHWRIGHKNDNEMFLYGDAVNRLAELEDKIENGTLYDFEFKIGQEVYIVCDWDINKAVKGTISEIELTTNKNGSFHRIYVDHDYIFSKKNPNIVQHRYIFTKKELFPTEAEAETKLKEKQNERQTAN